MLTPPVRRSCYSAVLIDVPEFSHPKKCPSFVFQYVFDHDAQKEIATFLIKKFSFLGKRIPQFMLIMIFDFLGASTRSVVPCVSRDWKEAHFSTASSVRSMTGLRNDLSWLRLPTCDERNFFDFGRRVNKYVCDFLISKYKESKISIPFTKHQYPIDFFRSDPNWYMVLNDGRVIFLDLKKKERTLSARHFGPASFVGNNSKGIFTANLNLNSSQHERDDRIFRIKDGKLVRIYHAEKLSRKVCRPISYIGDKLIAVTNNNKIMIWDIESSKLLGTAVFYKQRYITCTNSWGDNMLIGFASGDVCMLNMQKYDCLDSNLDYLNDTLEYPVHCITVCEKRNMLFVTYVYQLNVYDAHNHNILYRIVPPLNFPIQIVTTWDNKGIMIMNVGTENGLLRMWSLTNCTSFKDFIFKKPIKKDNGTILNISKVSFFYSMIILQSRVNTGFPAAAIVIRPFHSDLEKQVSYLKPGIYGFGSTEICDFAQDSIIKYTATSTLLGYNGQLALLNFQNKKT